MRRLFLAVVGLSTLAVVSAGALLWFLQGDGIRRALEAQASSRLGQPVSIATARAQLFPRLGIRLENVRIGQDSQVVLGRVDLSTGLRPLLSRRIENANVSVSNSRLQVPLPFTLQDDETSSATADFRVVSIRRIRVDNVSIVSRGRELDVSLDAAMNDTAVAVTALTVHADGTSVRGSGSLALDPTPSADLDLEADRVDVDDLLAVVQGFTPASEGRGAATATTPGRLTARIAAKEVSAGGVTLPQFSATARVQGGRISLAPMRFWLFGGRYEGDLDLDLTNALMTLSARVRDVDVAQLSAFGGVPDAITGRLSGAATLSGRGSDFAAMLLSGRGEGNASIVNGTIHNLNLVRTVVLFFGRPAPGTAAATDSFDRIDARFTISNRRLDATALSLRSRDSDIVGNGTLALDTKRLAGHVDLSLSEELSAQAGTDIYRYAREGNRVVLPASIDGTLGEPHLTIDAGAAASRGLRNELDRRFKGLIDQFRR